MWKVEICERQPLTEALRTNPIRKAAQSLLILGIKRMAKLCNYFDELA
jgi:hypothetical protein